MLPTFPVFNKLTIDHKDIVQNITNNFLPYSDFNFISMWCYDTEDTLEVSSLYGNLVVKFTDYITKQPFYSFIGRNDTIKTTSELLLLSEEKGFEPILRHIPEITILYDPVYKNNFNITEDEDDFDYILSTDNLISLSGNDYRGKRNFVNRFIRLYPHHKLQSLDMASAETRTQIENLFYKWEKQKEYNRDRTEIELTALHRFLKLPLNDNVIGLGIYVDSELIGFTLNELVHNNYAIVHFEKADVNFVGIYSYIKHKTAEYLRERGFSYINYEQDLGIEGLRKSKKAWNPVNYLKKYSVSL